MSLRTGRRAASALAAVLLAVALAGCDLFGPSGPGTLEATVSADEPVGGLILELRGEGITGFVGRGDTRVVSRPVSLAEGRHRVVLVAPGGRPLLFGIQVEDLGADPPSVVVVAAVDPANRASNARGIRIEVE